MARPRWSSVVEAGEISRRRPSTTPARASRSRSTRRAAAASSPGTRAPPCRRCRSTAPSSTTCDSTRSSPTSTRAPRYYRPLAAFLIGTGARISEAVAIQLSGISTSTQGVVRIYRQRARDGDATRADQGQAVPLRPDRPAARRRRCAERDDRTPAVRRRRLALPLPDAAPRPLRAAAPQPVPPSRKTVHDWHEAALVDAGLRDMPLHALRHTAAAAWLATGHPLIFVQRQLGHRSITTTEEHYGHLEDVVHARGRRADRGADQSGRIACARVRSRHRVPAAATAAVRRRPASEDLRRGGAPLRRWWLRRLRLAHALLEPAHAGAGRLRAIVRCPEPEPHRAVVAAEPDARNPAHLRRVVEPGSRDAEHVHELGRLE